MSVGLPNGAILTIASTYGAAKSVTIVTNAAEAVVTAVAHGYANGDFVEMTSGWSRLNGQIRRIKSITTDTFVLEGMDTTDTIKFPAGGGIGSVRKITAWTQINQVLEFAGQGGDQQFVNYSFLEEDTEHQIPTVKSAESFTMSIGDDATLPWYAILSAANDDRLPRALKLTLPAGSLILYDGYVTLNKTPTLTKNQIMALKSTVSLNSVPVRYAS